MGVVTLFEGTKLSWEAWHTTLGVEIHDVEHLRDAKILRQRDGGVYELTFVGIVVFERKLLFASPKFGCVRWLGWTEVLRILRSYFARSSLRRRVEDTIRNPEYGNEAVLREFDVLLGLQEWFRTHGIYRRDITQLSDRGRINWTRTIAKCAPAIVQGSPIYPSIVAERREGVLNDISALQVGILKQLLRRYDFPIPEAIRYAAQATGTTFSIWPVSEDSRTYFLRRLAIEQRTVFRTDTLRLLNLLREVLDTTRAGTAFRPQIYGTTAFYSVWEDACRVALSATVPADVAEAIGHPVWWTQSAEGDKVRSMEKQIPDMIISRGTWQLIIDAKYYFPFPKARPGAPDIIKQLYYKESLRAQQSDTLSIFILPVAGAETPVFLGYATIEDSQRVFDEIEAWGVDPVWLLSQYPNSSASRANSVVDGLIAQRGRVTEFLDQAPSDVSS